MYRNVIYDSKSERVIEFTWDENGKRIQVEKQFNPHLFLETTDKNKSVCTSLDGIMLTRRDFRNTRERADFIENKARTNRIYGCINAEQQYLIENYCSMYGDKKFFENPIKYQFYDIETYSRNGFPNPAQAKDCINVITVYDSIDKTYYTWGTKQIDDREKILSGIDTDNWEYVYCPDEHTLLRNFLNFVTSDYPDVFTGWNSELFDTPYIINRVERLLGPGYADRLSPVRQIYSRPYVNKRGQNVVKWTAKGMSMVDYQEIYIKFDFGTRPSYSLNNIAKAELGETKIPYDGSLPDLADNDWDTFVQYNVQDVVLLQQLEEKLQYIAALRTLSYRGLCTLDQAMGTIAMTNGAIYVKAIEKGMCIPTFTDSGGDGVAAGGYVGVPRRGMHADVASFDANSLYPNAKITLNLSPETKLGKIVRRKDGKVTIHTVNNKTITMSDEKFDNFIKDNEIAVSKAGVLFTQDVKGLIPEYIDEMYSERVAIKAEIKKDKAKLETLTKGTPEYKAIKDEIDLNDNKQFAIKIAMNSAYGYLANKHAPLGDSDLALSITLTGQAVIKEANEIIRRYVMEKLNIDHIKRNSLNDPILYNDTDSTYITIQPLIRHFKYDFAKNKEITPEVYELMEDIENYLNNNIKEWARRELNSKDPRFVFKREILADGIILLSKKRYVAHVLDDEGFKTDKFKYTGVEIVRTTIPDACKAQLKQVVECMLTTQNVLEANKIYMDLYRNFTSLSIEDIALVKGVNNYDKFADQCYNFDCIKGMPQHVKSAYYHNILLEKYDIEKKYNRINSGDKMRYFWVKKPNKWNIDYIAYLDKYPEEFARDIEIDYDKMFEKIIFKVISRFYAAAGWTLRMPTQQLKVNVLDLISRKK